MIVHTILYVEDQNRSTDFYKALLAMYPSLNVPGMTEFKLSDTHILGLMPKKGIKRLLGDKITNPTQTVGFPNAELYFKIDHPEKLFTLAIDLGAKELSPVKKRDWGDHAGYVLDLDNHVLAFANSKL